MTDPAVPAELFASLEPAAVRRWDAGLADSLREGLGLEPAGRPVMSLPDPDGVLQERLRRAGAVVAGRAGKVRLVLKARDASKVAASYVIVSGKRRAYKKPLVIAAKKLKNEELLMNRIQSTSSLVMEPLDVILRRRYLRERLAIL
jgi:hypothetical protein